MRACRAWLGINQKDAAKLAGLSDPTLIKAEKGQECSDRTWELLVGIYAARGAHIRTGDGPTVIVFMD